MHKSKISKELQRKLTKLCKKNKPLYEQVLRKISEVINSGDVEHYKNLRYDMKESKRAHIGHFVLIFQYDRKSNTVNFDDFDHHDKIYYK